MFTRIPIFLDGSPGSDTYLGLPIEGRDDPNVVPDPDEAKVGSEEEEKAEETPNGPETTEKPAEESDKAPEEGTTDEKDTDSESDKHSPTETVEVDVNLLNHLKGIQTRHDQGVNMLKEHHPNAYTDWQNRKAALDEKFKPPENEVPIAPIDPEEDIDEITGQLSAEAQQRNLRIAVREERNLQLTAEKQQAETKLQDDMVKAYDAEFKGVENYLAELSKATRMQNDGKTPMVQMGPDGKTPLTENGQPVYMPLIPPEVYQSAIKNVMPREPVPGAPQAALHDIMREIKLAMLERNLNETRVKIAADESEKVRKVKENLSQPAHAGATQPGKKSTEMEDIERRRAEQTGMPLDGLPEF